MPLHWHAVFSNLSLDMAGFSRPIGRKMRPAKAWRLLVAFGLSVCSAVTLTGSNFKRDLQTENPSTAQLSPAGMPAYGASMAGVVMQCSSGNVCSLECRGYRACASATLSCPVAEACTVVCDGVEACRGLQVSNPSSVTCRPTQTLVRLTTLNSNDLLYGQAAYQSTLQAGPESARGILSTLSPSAAQPVVIMSAGAFLPSASATVATPTASGTSNLVVSAVHHVCQDTCVYVPRPAVQPRCPLAANSAAVWAGHLLFGPRLTRLPAFPPLPTLQRCVIRLLRARGRLRSHL